MKKSEALIHVAGVFKTGYPRFGICNELMRLRDIGEITNRDYSMMVKKIRSLLGSSNGYLEHWLIKNNPQFRDQQGHLSGPIHTQKMNETRARWCAHMAKHWKNKGQ